MEEDEENATQQATQQFLDPRRLGQGSSGLSDADLADIFCILVPSSLPAHKAVAFIHESTPQHTISSHSDARARLEKVEGPHLEHEEDNSFDVASQRLVSCDIALRLSATLKSEAGGFHFGRNQARCDIVLGRDDHVKRVSNVHFRIYINDHGTIMLEDQSTNGTIVDNTLLKNKDKENGRDQHTLGVGSLITLTMTPPEQDFRFIVRIPQRDDEAERKYQENLTNYFICINRAQKEREARILQTRGDTTEPLRGDPPNIFATPDYRTPNPSLSSGRYVKEWKGGQKYNKIATIGKGAFAVVYKITAKYDGVPFAAKELEKRRFMKNGILEQKVDQEMRIMQRIHHPNIVQFIEHIDWEEYLYIIMEYVPNGDLGSLIGRGGAIQELEVKVMAKQLLDALKYLHNMQITHRDVKPDNILIQSFSPFTVKLTDFGLSKIVDSEETFLRTFCGTLLYCAPEVYTEYREYDSTGKRAYRGELKKFLPPQRYDHAVDIWSLAGVLFYALCASAPYPAKNGVSYLDLLHEIMTKALDIRPLQHQNVSEPGIRFIKSMLHIRPEYRATISELESSSWFTGIDSQEMSYDEDDEVDLIRAGYESELEGGASQLSINQPDDVQIDDSQGNMSDLTDLQRPEIPGSFETSDGQLNGHESYGFMNGHAKPGNGRLFGEVDVSALGSSGAIPHEHLPTPRNGHHFHEHSYGDFNASEMDPQHESEKLNLAGSWAVMGPPPPLPATERKVESGESEHNATRSSSLMGAESMVGHLNMQSPAAASLSAASPLVDEFATEVAPDIVDTGVSLRRRREDDDLPTDGYKVWHPSDFPASKRRKSTREIDIQVPPSVFWDPKDKSTHHTDYPAMSYSNYRTYQEYAAKKGQTFTHGENIFESTMHSFRSPSHETTEAARAYSEPTRDEGRRIMLHGEESLLDEEEADDSEPARTHRDITMPSTARGSNEPDLGTFETDPGINITSIAQPVVGNDFQPPKRILAKIVGDIDSCLPTVNLNVTEPLTSWGRGFKNTIRYSNGQDIRVPKYAFKIFLFKPNFYTSAGLPTNATPGNGKNSADHDMTFYISNKASSGITINGIKLPSFDRQNPCIPSKFWGELRNGDIINVWQHDSDNTQFTRFKFECYWGVSMNYRQAGQRFSILPKGELLDELESACLGQESSILAEIELREKEEKEAQKAEQKRQRESQDTRGTTHAHPTPLATASV